MAWPGATDYTTAVQNPATAFGDADLRIAAPECNAFLGLPLSYCGNFAIVFKLVAPTGEMWAVKCFTRRVTDHQSRYAAIARHLEQVRRRFAVDFNYLEQGIRVGGAWFPCVKMRWVEGQTLNEFLRDHCHKPAVLDQLGELWLRLAGDLRESRMAHGDLQHGNVLLVPGKTVSSAALRLVDYDGMWVPELDGRPPGERGHPNYQHPQRLAAGGYSADIDRFANLVIYTALRCLRAGGKALWERHDNGENLLFREADFAAPGRSKLLAELFDLPDGEAVTLAGHLIAASQGPLDAVPLLSDLMPFGPVRPLSGEQREMLRALIPGAKPFRKADVTPVPKPKSSPQVAAITAEETEALAARVLRDRPIPPAAPPPPAALTFGDYELLEELARGVSWRVYRARQGVTGRVVRLHTLTVEPQEHRHVLAESEVGSALTHPNVLTVYEVGQRDGVIYLAAEDATGGSLAHRLGRLRDSPRKTVPLLIQAARAVQFAHDRFVLHRALGSETVLLDPDGTVRVVGFGLSPRGARVPRPFGGAAYAAPEAARGEEGVGPAADVWSLGALLYEGLTGQPPVLDGVDPSGPVPPWEINRDADPGLSDIALWCLKADPRLRYPIAAKLAAELERWMIGAPVVLTLTASAPAPPPLPRKTGAAGPPPRVPPRSRLAVSVAVVALLVGGLAWVMTRPSPNPPLTEPGPVRRAPRPVTLSPVRPVEVWPGRPFRVEFVATWDGRTPPPALTVLGVPEGVEAGPPAVRHDGPRLVFAVDFTVRPDLREGVADVLITLTRRGRPLDETHLRLFLNRSPARPGGPG